MSQNSSTSAYGYVSFFKLERPISQKVTILDTQIVVVSIDLMARKISSELHDNAVVNIA